MEEKGGVDEDEGLEIEIIELLSEKRVALPGGLPQYANCFRQSIGEGYGKNMASLKRLRRLSSNTLLQINVRLHDHQVAIMNSIRGYITEMDTQVEHIC